MYAAVSKEQQIPMTSSISQLAFPSPRTSVCVPVSHPIDLVTGVLGLVVKSCSLGVIEQDSPVSITIGSPLGIVDTYIVRFCKGRCLMYCCSVL